MISSGEKQRRVQYLLDALGQHSPRREAAILALADDEAPSPISVMARLGFKFSDGAPNKKLLDEVARRTGLPTIDRESRDSVQLPLRELGIIIKATAEPKEARFIPYYWKPKSNHCVYRLDEEFKSLLECSASEFKPRAEIWLSDTESRKARMRTAESAAWAAHEGGRLVPATIALYCATFLPGYTPVYVDDKDGDRIDAIYQDAITRLGIPLNLAGRWPDILLHNPESNVFWVVDCVESDGEVDYVRRDEMETSFEEAGLTIAGFTTAYRTLAKFAQRQRKHDNIADNTFVWVMEVGGSHWQKQLPSRTETGWS
ncbi:BsuBI/PstI family type II restriction endonuclease [Micromonospora ureilytica]|uniref:BsuBI/PstI restriction endonuclease domain-containing protein n=1 Tax=Micromonospora ureilytica TaxID=709868 RepID=A0ABS0JQT2_9ACTN|nr:BsuBI/PstI family type II restriction endonuclease [Micromonospora ureilytica]MBG6069180.1 hypothetical protein [Micromonospora ureilytica]